MKSRTSYFNRTLFMKNFTRFWPIWALYLVIWILVMPIPMMNQFYYSYNGNIGMRITETVLQFATYGGLFMSASFCAVAAALVFMFTYNARSTNFVASLPLSRECVFVTTYLSGLCWFIVSNVIVFLLTLLAMTSGRYVEPMALLQWFGIVSLFNLIFYSIAVICVIIAGNIVGAILLYAAANGGLVITEILVRLISAEYIKGLTFMNDFTDAFTRYLTPVIQLWGKVVATYSRVDYVDYYEYAVTAVKYTGWPSLLIYAAVGVILSVIALLLYRRRQMETASDLISVKPLRPVFKYLATFFCALTIGMLTFVIVFAFSTPKFSQIPLTVCMIFGAAIGYFGSEMLLHKSFRVFKRGWKGFAVCALVIVLVMTCISLDVFGIAKRVPDPANVKSVELGHGGYYDDTEIEDAENIKTVTEIHKLLLTGDYSANIGGDNFTDNAVDYSVYSTTITITYNMKNGSTMTRRYYARIPKNSELYKLLDGLLNTGDAVLSRVMPRVQVTSSTIITGEIYGDAQTAEGEYQYVNFYLDSAQARYLYENCIIPDAKDGKIGRVTVDGYSEQYDYNMTVYLEFENSLMGQYGYDSESDSFHLSIPITATRTIEYINELAANEEYMSQYDYTMMGV